MKGKLIGVAAAVMGALAVGVGPAGATAPRIATTSVNVSFPDGYYTGFCGFAVNFFNVGTFDTKLYSDQAGTIVREIDTSPHDRVGWSSPDTAKTVVFPNAAQLTTDYPQGIAVGSPATVTGSGLTAKIPGLPADAGIAVFAGHVAFVDTDGVPIVAFDQFISNRGHANDPAAFDAALCAALAP
jgi:hypothetical protein